MEVPTSLGLESEERITERTNKANGLIRWSGAVTWICSAAHICEVDSWVTPVTELQAATGDGVDAGEPIGRPSRVDDNALDEREIQHGRGKSDSQR